MRPLNAFEQRIAALGLTTVVLVILYLLLVHWWFTAPLSIMGDEEDSLREAHRHYSNLIAQRQGLEQRLAQVNGDLKTADTLLTGPDTGAGSAQLMGLLASYVQGAATNGGGCSISNRMPINSRIEEFYIPVKISMNLECGAEPLGKLLYRIENARPYLFIESLTIRKPEISNSDQKESGLVVQLLVTGYLRNEDGEAGSQQ